MPNWKLIPYIILLPLVLSAQGVGFFNIGSAIGKNTSSGSGRVGLMKYTIRYFRFFFTLRYFSYIY